MFFVASPNGDVFRRNLSYDVTGDWQQFRLHLSSDFQPMIGNKVLDARLADSLSLVGISWSGRDIGPFSGNSFDVIIDEIRFY